MLYCHRSLRDIVQAANLAALQISKLQTSMKKKMRFAFYSIRSYRTAKIPEIKKAVRQFAFLHLATLAVRFSTFSQFSSLITSDLMKS